MQIKLYTIPILGGEAITEEMNAFIRSRKVLLVEMHMATEGGSSFWCFCIRFLDASKGMTRAGRKQPKVDYKQVLDEDAFKRFSRMRTQRKLIAQEEAIPAYAVFTNAELAEIAKIGADVSPQRLLEIDGIGKKKVEKYGARIINDEES